MKILKYFCVIFLCFIVFAGCSVQNKDSKNKPDESTIAALFDENINCIKNIFVLSSLPHTDEEFESNVYVVVQTMRLLKNIYIRFTVRKRQICCFMTIHTKMSLNTLI